MVSGSFFSFSIEEYLRTTIFPLRGSSTDCTVVSAFSRTSAS